MSAQTSLFVLLLLCLFCFDPSLAQFTCDPSCTGASVPLDGDDLIVKTCLKVTAATTSSFGLVNIIDGGTLCVEETANTRIELKVKSILVEMGGTFQAGSVASPFGSAGGSLAIQLYGPHVDPGGTGDAITCKGSAGSTGTLDSGCYPARFTDGNAYCCDAAVSSTDPCQTDCTATPMEWNSRFVQYGGLNYDDNPFGYKVFAVSYGGSLELYGASGVQTPSSAYATTCDAPSSPDMSNEWSAMGEHSWARLAKTYDPDTAPACTGEVPLTLDHAVDWKKDDKLAIGPSGWHASHAEILQVTSVISPTEVMVKRWGAGLSGDQLCPQHPHAGDLYTVDPTLKEGINVDVVDVDSRAVVSLLTRSITIESWGKDADTTFPEPADCAYDKGMLPDCYFGGHVIFRQGFAKVAIQGVEFYRLGQGARMGHYSVHFHLAKDMAFAKPFVRDSAVWDSMTRWFVLHGTHGVNLERNTGFLSVGHGYYLEDGVEINNRLCHNVGLVARASLINQFKAWAESTNHATDDPRRRALPAILHNTQLGLNEVPGVRKPWKTNADANGVQVMGTDTYQPTTFWITNTWNEFVGNVAQGTTGWGVCYWLVPMSISGPNYYAPPLWEAWPKPNDFFNVNPAPTAAEMERVYSFWVGVDLNGNYAANRNPPLYRFEGNSCGTSAYALFTTFNVFPTDANDAIKVDVEFGPNPYGTTINSPPVAPYLPPSITGGVSANFIVQTALGGVQLPPCQEQTADGGASNPTCAAAVVNRFHTSFNWGQTNLASVWIRRSPFWIVSSSSVTDQLYGGFNYVAGGGAWTQLPLNSWSLLDGMVFIGRTHDALSDSSYLGPTLDGTMCSTLYCLSYIDGGYWYTGEFNPKRYLNIYDGPMSADNAIFIDTPPLTCKWSNGAESNCQELTLEGKLVGTAALSIYSLTIQPCLDLTQPAPEFGKDNGGVVTATCSTVGADIFIPCAAVGWKQPNGFYYPPAFGMRGFRFDTNTLRHNVVNKYVEYSQSKIPAFEEVNYSTIVNDIDGSFTGLVAKDQTRTSSVSLNRFLDATPQVRECLSFGLQTSSLDFITLTGGNVNMGAGGIGAVPASNNQWIKLWRQNVNTNVSPENQATEYGAGEVCEPCTSGTTSPCSTADKSCTLDCNRASVLFTPGETPAALVPNTGVFYVDSSVDSDRTGCIQSIGNAYPLNQNQGETIFFTVMFTSKNSAITVQTYAGVGATATFARYEPHNLNKQFIRPDPDGNAYADAYVKKYGALPTADANGIIEINMDTSLLDPTYYDTRTNFGADCLPRDLCLNPSSDGGACRINPDYFLYQNSNDANLKSSLEYSCSYWATRYSGTVKSGTTLDGETEPSDITFAECPHEGCLAVVITLGDMSKTAADRRYNGLANVAPYTRGPLKGKQLSPAPFPSNNPCTAYTTVLQLTGTQISSSVRGLAISNTAGTVNSRKNRAVQEGNVDDLFDGSVTAFVCQSGGQVLPVAVGSGEQHPEFQLSDSSAVIGCNLDSQRNVLAVVEDGGEVDLYDVDLSDLGGVIATFRRSFTIPTVVSGGGCDNAVSFREADGDVFVASCDNSGGGSGPTALIIIQQFDHSGILLSEVLVQLPFPVSAIGGLAYDPTIMVNGNRLLKEGGVWVVVDNADDSDRSVALLLDINGNVVGNSGTPFASNIIDPHGLDLIYGNGVPVLFVLDDSGSVTSIEAPALESLSPLIDAPENEPEDESEPSTDSSSPSVDSTASGPSTVVLDFTFSSASPIIQRSPLSRVLSLITSLFICLSMS